jgi:hypothetical protein
MRSRPGVAPGGGIGAEEAEMTERFGFVAAFASFLSEHEQRERIVGPYVAALERIGGARWAPEQVAEAVAGAPLFLLVATGGTMSPFA